MKADFVKIRVDDNLGTSRKMPQEVYEAVISEAHKHKLRVAAHLYYLDDARKLLAAGADLIAHSIRDQAGGRGTGDDAQAAERLRLSDADARGLDVRLRTDARVLRRSVLHARVREDSRRSGGARGVEGPEASGDGEASTSAQQYKKALEMASRNLKCLQDAGVGIAFGTDTGPPARFQGYFEHMELELMVKAGLTPAQALTAATSGAADCMKVAGQLGALVPGAWADFVVLDKNPLEDIRNTRTIASVWVAGGALSRP